MLNVEDSAVDHSENDDAATLKRLAVRLVDGAAVLLKMVERGLDDGEEYFLKVQEQTNIMNEMTALFIKMFRQKTA